MERLIVILCLLIQLPLFAQEPTVHRHEVGLDVSNLLVHMIGRNRDQLDMTLTYKRVQNHWAFRSSFNLAFREHETFRLQEVKDGLHWYHHDLEKSFNYIGRIGLERRYQVAGRAMLAIGIDLVYGYLPTFREVTAYSYSPANVPNQPPDNYPVPGLIQVSQQPWENVQRTAHSMGLDGTAALLFPLGDRFLLSIKHRTSLHYNLYKTTVDRFSPKESTTTKDGAMTLTRGPGLIAEINFYYLFSSKSKK